MEARDCIAKFLAAAAKADAAAGTDTAGETVGGGACGG